MKSTADKNTASSRDVWKSSEPGCEKSRGRREGKASRVKGGQQGK